MLAGLQHFKIFTAIAHNIYTCNIVLLARLTTRSGRDYLVLFSADK